MEEIKAENELRHFGAKKDNLCNQLDKIHSHSSDIWSGLEDYLKSAKEKVENRFRELALKETELQDKSSELEQRAKVVKAGEAEAVYLERKSDGFRMEIEAKGKELDILRNQVEVFRGESSAEEVRLSHLRKSVEECETEQRTKISQLSEVVESLRSTQVELGLKGQELAQIETDLERQRGEVSAEIENLGRTQTLKRQLDEEVERETKNLTLLQDKIAECEKLLQTRSSKLAKTQGELDLKLEQLGAMETDLEKHRVVVSAEKEHLERTQTLKKQLVEEVERETKNLTLLQDKIDECEKLLQTRSSELIKTQGELDLKREQLGAMGTDLEKHRVEVSAEKERLERTQTHSGELEEEIDRKQKDLAAVLDKIAECGKQLESVEEQLDSQQKLLEARSCEVVSKKKELQALILDIDLREQTVISLNNDMKETGQQMESKAKELEDIQRQIEEKSAHCDSIKLLIKEQADELSSKEKKQNEMTEAIRKLESEIVFKEKTLERSEVFIQQLSDKQDSEEKKLDFTRRHLKRCIDEHEWIKEELRSAKKTFKEYRQHLDIKEKELKSVQSVLTERSKQVEEGEKEMQRLNISNENLISQIKLKQEEVCSINESIRECTGELEAKKKHFDQVQRLITDPTAVLKSKGHLNSVNKDSLKDFQSKEEEQVRLKASLVEREQGLQLKEKELYAREEKINKKDKQLKSKEQKLAKSYKETELKAKKLSNFCQKCNQDQHVDLVRDANVCDEKTLQLLLRGHLKKCPQLHLDVLNSLKASSDPAKLVLDTIQGIYSAQQRTTVTNLDPNSVRRSSICLLECLMDMSLKPSTEVQGKAIKFATEWKNTTLIKAENPVEVLGFLHFLAAFSLAYTFDADKVQTLFDFAFLRKYAPSLCKALGVTASAPVNNVLSLDDKPAQQPPEAPISNSNDSRSPNVQENLASSHLANEDALRDIVSSSSFSPNEVSTKLPMFKDPGRFVLTSVEDALIGACQRGELSLEEPIVKTLAPFLEELPCVVSSIDPDLQSDATKVAHQWSVMMGTNGQKSQLEAWAFLQFIVAYGLVKQIKQDETLQFASNVAHFKQAPKLFHSLGLSFAIPNFVEQLLSKALYFPAIRFMLSFNVKNNFSPLDFLKEEIINLRRSVKEKRRSESQADAAKMMDIMELIEDFKLEIDLPVDLILKFMVPREIQNQNQRAVSSYVPVPFLPTIFGAAPNPRVVDVEAGGSTAFQCQTPYQAGFKRPRVDPGGPRPAIRPCLNPQSGYGRF